MEATAEDLERERSHSRSSKHGKTKSGQHTPKTPKSGHQTPESHEHHHPLGEKIVRALFEPPKSPPLSPRSPKLEAEKRKSHEHHLHDLTTVLSFGASSEDRHHEEEKARKSLEKRKSHEHHRPDLKSILSFGHSSHDHKEEKARKSLEKEEKRKSGEHHEKRKSGEHASEHHDEHHKHPHLEKLAHDMFDPPHPTDRPHMTFHRHSHSHDKNAEKPHGEKRKSGEHHPHDRTKLFSFEATKDDILREEEKVRKSIEKAEARKSGEHQPHNLDKLISFEATAADRKHEEEKVRKHLKCGKGKCIAKETQEGENCPHERTEVVV
ncbi:hypothetical protein EX30DRAFT_219939 [Ascodesmis nigricans]|uniref:Uncharacterized protein n=1 Tax=Ascodesmis nigricans TaxID=341454 RepID=A0A4S2N061_9PEZI|nr:hypothetical protein EX30DRAFT_219939 [Ascodesmis nigricans]